MLQKVWATLKETTGRNRDWCGLRWNEVSVTGHWRKGSSCKTAKNLTELCSSVLWKVDLEVMLEFS